MVLWWCCCGGGDDACMHYQVWLGGSPDLTRVGYPYQDKVNIDANLESYLKPIFAYFKEGRKDGEAFGDFVDRVGVERVREYHEKHQVAA